jgi:hypothetical protein
MKRDDMGVRALLALRQMPALIGPAYVIRKRFRPKK